jgi:hypothetical protein
VSELVERVHGADCPCTRCQGFREGNELGVRFAPGNRAAERHGGYSLAGLEDRGKEIAEEIRPTLPAGAVCDEPVLQLLALTLARVERGAAAIERVDDLSESLRLSHDLRAWVNGARRLANDLGLTPTSRARLGLDIAATRRTLSLIEAYSDESER